MQPYWQSHNGETTLTIYQGDVLDALRQLPDESVHCCITSPPYWGLRDYGVDGQIGREPTPEEYVERLVEVFREVRRVLRRDGTLWLNLGDCYAGSSMTGGVGRGTLTGSQHGSVKGADLRFSTARDWSGLKPKDLMGLPWAVAFALRDDGWYLRSDIIWAKPNPMPESVADRPTKAHEYVFLLSKSARYHYDADAIREPHEEISLRRAEWESRRKSDEGWKSANRQGGLKANTVKLNPAGRNKRSVWTIATEPYPEAHFATFPTALVEPMILAGTSPQACPQCGAPWERVVDVTSYTTPPGERHGRVGHKGTPPQQSGWFWRAPDRRERGWQPTCTCPDNDGSGRCVVLDPFLGSGTTLLVAQRLGRSGIGIELSPDYCAMAARRLEREHAQTRLPVGGGL